MITGKARHPFHTPSSLISVARQGVIEGFRMEGDSRPLKQWTRATMHLDEEGQLPPLVHTHYQISLQLTPLASLECLADCDQVGANAVMATYDLVAVRITVEATS